MAIEVFNRIEKKYLISEDIYDKFYKEIKPYMEEDKYCKNGNYYSINNLYYDTDTDELIRRSMEKPVYKEKLRLRSYGIPKSEDRVFLEIKKKYRGVVNKRRTKLTLKQAEDFVNKGIVPTEGDYINHQVVKEIDYFIKFYKPRPKLFLAYDRVALFGKDDHNLRITFDRNIRTRRNNPELEKGDTGKQLLPAGKVLVEIKTSDSLPMWLTEILNRNEIRSTSFSKYGTEYANFITKESKI
jgi:SPX domain protein involved in polyphosphate accumulation